MLVSTPALWDPLKRSQYMHCCFYLLKKKKKKLNVIKSSVTGSPYKGLIYSTYPSLEEKKGPEGEPARSNTSHPMKA